jgi:hypothetical protein
VYHEPPAKCLHISQKLALWWVRNWERSIVGSFHLT